MTPVTEKLRKLIEHEKSARSIGNISEAEAFAAKITELLFKHNMEMSDVEIAQQEKDEPIDREYVSMGGKRSAWMEMLADTVAKSCFCGHMILPGTDSQIFVGRTSDRVAAAALYRYLAGCGISLCNGEKREFRKRNPYVDSRQRQQFANRFGKSFMLGFASAISQRLHTQLDQLAACDSGCALVLRKSDAVDQWFNQKHFGFARSINVSANSTDGFSRGIRAGHAVSLKARAALNE